VCHRKIISLKYLGEISITKIFLILSKMTMVLLLILLTKLGQIEMFPAAKRTKNVYLIYITDRFPISPSTSMVIVQSTSRRNNERRQNNCGWPIAWAWGPLSQLAVVRTCIPAITIARVYSGAAFFSTHILLATLLTFQSRRISHRLPLRPFRHPPSVQLRQHLAAAPDRLGKNAAAADKSTPAALACVTHPPTFAALNN